MFLFLKFGLIPRSLFETVLQYVMHEIYVSELIFSSKVIENQKSFPYTIVGVKIT